MEKKGTKCNMSLSITSSEQDETTSIFRNGYGGVKKYKEKQRNKWFKCQISCSSGDQ